MPRFNRTFATFAIAAAMSICGITAMSEGNINSRETGDKRKPKSDLERIIVPEFERYYDVIIHTILGDVMTLDSSTVWQSHKFNDSTYKIGSNLPRRTKVIDGRAKIKIGGIYTKDIEFRTYLDDDGMPVEDITVTRGGKNELTAYDSTIIRREFRGEFSDWKDIRTLGHTIFYYEKGIARTPSNKYIPYVQDTVAHIADSVLAIQPAYFMMSKIILNRRMPFDTTIHILYKGTKYPVDTHTEEYLLKTDSVTYQCRKFSANLTYQTKEGRKSFVDGLGVLTVYMGETGENRGLPLRIDSEESVLFGITPYARQCGTRIKK